MIKDNQKYFNRLQVVLDGLVIIISYLIAWYNMMMKATSPETGAGVLPPEVYMMALVILAPFFLLLYYACNLYTPKRVQGRRLEGSNIVKANTLGCLIFMAVLYLLHQGDVSRRLIAVFFMLNVALTFAERNIVLSLIHI